MARKLACVVYLSSYRGSIDAVEERLQALNFEVHTFEVTEERAQAVQAGDLSSLPDELRQCMQTADLCVLLLDERAEGLAAIGGLGSDMGCQVVTIGGDPEVLPAELDDVIDGHVPDIDLPIVDEVIEGEPERIKPDGEPADERKANRVKCQ